MDNLLGNSDSRNKVGGFLFGFAGVGFAASLIVVERWARAAPTKPNPALGQLFPHNEHGWITYFTAFQATSSHMMFWCTFVSIALAIAALPKQLVSVRRWGRMPVAASWENDDKKGLAKRSAFVGALFAPFVFFAIGPVIVTGLNSHGIVLNL